MIYLEVKPELYADIVRNAKSADAHINCITFDTDNLVLTIDLLMEKDSVRAKNYLYSNVYLGEWDAQSFMQHVRNIVASVAKHHATLDVMDVERFRREVLY